MFKPPLPRGLGGGSVVLDYLFIVTPIVEVCNCSILCCTLLYVHSSFAIILMGKRKLFALLSLSSWCLVVVVWLFLAVPWACQHFKIVVFPGHTHLLFLIIYSDTSSIARSTFMVDLHYIRLPSFEGFLRSLFYDAVLCERAGFFTLISF